MTSKHKPIADRISEDFTSGLLLFLIIFVVFNPVHPAFISTLILILFFVLLLAVIFYKKPLNRELKWLLDIARICSLIAFCSGLVTLYSLISQHRNRASLAFSMGLIMYGLMYKTLFDWTTKAEFNKRIDLQKYKAAIISIVGLYLLVNVFFYLVHI